MQPKIAVDMSIDIGLGPQEEREERGARVGIDREAGAEIDVIDPDVK
jgi:hypothetical protein